MSIRIEEVQPGDVLYCTHGGACCARAGERYTVELDEGELKFKPSCWEDYSDWAHVNAYLGNDDYDFVLEKAANPW